MLRLIGFSIAVFLCFGIMEHVSGQVIADVEFDKNKAKYLSGYTFGGYGPANGANVKTFDEDLSFEVSDEKSAGCPANMIALQAELKEAKARQNDDHKAIQAKIDKLKKEPNACAKIDFDTSAVKLPSDATFDYMGVGLGVTFDLTDDKLPSHDMADYEVSFDARVAGTESLSQSKVIINFVTEDGDDEDKFGDVVLQLVRGEDDGTNAFTINSEYKTFTFSLDSMIEKQGKASDLKGAKLNAMTVNVQAQGNVSDFSTDKDNVLYVDNVRLVKK